MAGGSEAEEILKSDYISCHSPVARGRMEMGLQI